MSVNEVGRAWIAAFVLASGTACGVTLTVSPDGDDSGIGTSHVPLASLDGAKARVRAVRAETGGREPVEVVFEDGDYRLDRPVVFDPADSGTPDAPVRYRAARGAHPSFCAGVRLPRFEVGADGVWRTRVDPALRFEQLYVNGRRAVRARSPNRFYYYMQAPAPFGVDPLTDKPADLSRRSFFAKPSDVAALAGKSRGALSNVVVTVYHSWEVSHARVQAVDLETGRMVVTGSSPWPFFCWGTYLPRYHIENFREALDEPGEWFLDADGTLYYLPLPGEQAKRTEAVAPVADAFLLFKGDAMSGAWVSDVTFEGLAFSHAAYRLPPNGQGDGQAAVTQPAAVELDGARRVAFRDCAFEHVGAHGVWFRKGCRECAFERCRVFDVGGGAVRIGDSKWDKAELPDKLTDGVTVDNCILHAGGRFLRGATGVWIGHASDVRVTRVRRSPIRFSRTPRKATSVSSAARLRSSWASGLSTLRGPACTAPARGGGWPRLRVTPRWPLRRCPSATW